MQSWTTTKPDRPGYWWGLTSEGDAVVVLIFPVSCEIEDFLYIDFDGDLVDIKHGILKNWKWGSNKITEPVGERI